MDEILEILLNPELTVDGKISRMKEKSVNVIPWSVLLNEYEPNFHRIVKDQETRKDKPRSDGQKDKASRITIGLEKLLCKRVNEFTFSIPVKRVYSNIGSNDKNVSDKRQEVIKAIESVFKNARIDNENIKRGLAYYASCEIFTLWYAVEKKNTLYGFESDYKLKCSTFSPMDGAKLYPLLDEYGDMTAMSVEYTKKVNDDTITFFETWTATKHFKWKNVVATDVYDSSKDSHNGWVEITPEGGEDVIILKIPGIYCHRKFPVYHGLSVIREEIEYALSRNSDVIAYNSAPVLKVVGGMAGEEKKGETQRIVRVINGGDVAYVSWSQSIEALKYHVETLINLYFMQAQMPDISFENMKSLGNIGYDARMTLLTDAHLKIGDESGAWIEFLDREVNVVKAFLKQCNAKDSAFVNEIDNVDVENVITPYIQNDFKNKVDTLMKANGGKALMSQLDSIRELGLTDDAEGTCEQIHEEEKVSMATRMNGLFEEGAM